VRAAEKARAIGMTTIGLSGQAGGQLRACCDLLLNVPSSDTPRIQEAHILIGHIICQAVEQEMFG
jgi:D-sedoheptulose 7-phosphate isomerase